jgi:hypothetical protein
MNKCFKSAQGLNLRFTITMPFFFGLYHKVLEIFRGLKICTRQLPSGSSFLDNGWYSCALHNASRNPEIFFLKLIFEVG